MHSVSTSAAKFIFFRIGRFMVALALATSYTGPSTANADPLESASSYTLNTGDTVQITVFEEPDLSIVGVLDDTGSISYPLLGEIQIRGLTARELEEAIIAGLKGRLLINPRVNVSILEYRPFYVRGEVNSPGGYPFKPGLTVEKAVSMAGGFTSRASN
ncbi:MAG: polysaccharide biosynthesis/export family protein, partial [Cyanobacteria bacterium P01_F01_bin.3]